MIQRCSNSKSPVYRYYGARGITVCDRWKVFVNFLADMGEKPKGKQLDRINNDGNYEPGNCRWITHWEQCRNFRRNIRITVGNETMILQDWADKLGVHEENLRRWYHAGLWPQDPNYRGLWRKVRERAR
jgi:hypothetical protein